MVRQVNTGYKLCPHEWNAANMEIVFPPGIDDSRRNYLVKLDTALREDTKRLRSIISRLGRTDDAYTADDVVERYLSPADGHCFLSFAGNLIRQLRQIGKGCTADMDYARDLFMFSFYTRGMSFVDMAFLKKNLQNGILSYHRHKTGQRLFIKWEDPMREIVAKYDTAGTPCLPAIIRATVSGSR